MDIHAEIELDICPICGGAGLLDEENDFCWAVYCMDCGAHTASIEYRTPSERFE
ncbi:MAG: Lar family restriction alleviation protein, partial [Oscillospiraceae bacterium]|nr:Lar family restriction alleviation protein [Oscillospiraceae bacterium]